MYGLNEVNRLQVIHLFPSSLLYKRAAKCYVRILSYFSISRDLPIFTLPELKE